MTVFSALSGSARVKAARRMLVKLTHLATRPNIDDDDLSCDWKKKRRIERAALMIPKAKKFHFARIRFRDMSTIRGKAPKSLSSRFWFDFCFFCFDLLHSINIVEEFAKVINWQEKNKLKRLKKDCSKSNLLLSTFEKYLTTLKNFQKIHFRY